MKRMSCGRLKTQDSSIASHFYTEIISSFAKVFPTHLKMALGVAEQCDGSPPDGVESFFADYQPRAIR